MRGLISRMFGRHPRRPRPSAGVSGLSSELTSSDIESYYLRIIVDVLRRFLVASDSVEIGVKRTGAAGPDGLPAYAGYIRILRWEPIMPVLLQNIPVLDARVRKIAEASVLLENTRFAGLWFQATSAVEGAPETLIGLPAELLVHPTRG